MRTSIIAVVIVSLLPLLAADWPQWRGQNRGGKSPEIGLLREWPAEGPVRLWQAVGLGSGFSSHAVVNGQVIYADGLFYLQGEGGEIALVEPSPDSYKEISRFSIGRGAYPVWTLPVIVDGMLLVRDQDTLTAFSLKR